MTTTTITVSASNALELEAKVKALQDIAAIAPAHRNRLHEIAKNPNALEGLASNWNLLKSFIKK